MHVNLCSCTRHAATQTGGGSILAAGSTSSSSRATSQVAQARIRPSRSMRCNSTDPAALQDVIVGGAVTAAVGAALFSGLKKEPRPCELCAGNGGIRCFACQGIDLIDPGLLPGGSGNQQQQQQQSVKRDIVGRSGLKPGTCRVCAGTGLVLCSKCRGSGYVSTF